MKAQVASALMLSVPLMSMKLSVRRASQSRCYVSPSIMLLLLHFMAVPVYALLILRSSCVAKLFVAINVVIILQVATEQM